VTRKRHAQTLMLAAALLCALVQVGCQRAEQPYSTSGGATFARDFEGERRVLRIAPSSEQPASCIETSLPSVTSGHWKSVMLAPEMHRTLIELLFDEARLPSYQADLDAVEESGTLVCSPRPSEPDFCYLPEVTVTGDVPRVLVKVAGTAPPRFVRSPLRFGLQEQVALSREGRELIDAFLDAHQACWNPED
jgi:hypothetical protein